MLASMLVWWYSFHMMEKTRRNTLLVAILVVYAIVWSVVHTIFAFTTAFQLHFAALVIVGIVRLNAACVKTSGRSIVPFVTKRPQQPPRVQTGHTVTPLYPRREDLQPICVGYIGYLLVAFVGWIIDQKACSLLHNLPFNLPNPQLHALWHVLVGINCQFGITFVISLRQSINDATGHSQKPNATTPHLRWSLGIWPYAAVRECTRQKDSKAFE